MTLKDLYEDFTADEIKKVISDYLEKNIEYRLTHNFEDYVDGLCKCSCCEEINEIDNMTYHKWDIGENEEMICEGCREDEDR